MFNVSRQRRHHWCAVMRATTARHCSYLHPHSDDSDGKHNTIKIDFLECVLCMLNKARSMTFDGRNPTISLSILLQNFMNDKQHKTSLCVIEVVYFWTLHYKLA